VLGWKGTASQPASIGFQGSDAKPPAAPGNGPAGNATPIWLENVESHGICVAPTGAGKGRSSLIPQLLTWQGSAVVIDPKGEAAAVTADFRRDVLKQRVVFLDPFHMVSDTPDSLNPLDAIQFSGESPEEFALMAPQLLHPDYPSGSTLKEPFWDNSGDNLISGLLCHILTGEPPENRHFPRLRELLMADDVVYSLAVLLDTVGKKMPKMAYSQIANFLAITDVTRSGVLSTAQQHMRLLADPRVIAALDRTTLDLQAFQRGEPVTIYIILPPTRLLSHGMLLRSWLSTLFTVAMSRTRTPKTPTLFLVDEVAALGAMDHLRTAFTLLRGYGVKVFIYLQDLHQLQRLYPQDWQTLINNAGTVQTFGLSNYLMARQVAEIFGELRPEEFLRLAPGEQMILFHGGRVEKCMKLDYLTDKLFRGLYRDNPRYAVEDKAAPGAPGGKR